MERSASSRHDSLMYVVSMFCRALLRHLGPVLQEKRAKKSETREGSELQHGLACQQPDIRGRTSARSPTGL